MLLAHHTKIYKGAIIEVAHGGIFLMPGLTYEQIVAKICQEKEVSQEEIEAKVKEKLNQLSDLISKQGAAHIIANEYGVRVYDPQTLTARKVQIRELLPALRGIELLAKVTKVFEVRSFKTANREGRVVNLMIADETGSCRLVLWDEKQIQDVEQGKVKEGDILKISNAYVRPNSFGNNEVHMGNQASFVVNPEGETLENVKTSLSPEKKAIKDLTQDDTVTLVGTIVQIFEPRFYDACPECQKKVVTENGVFKCVTHGIVQSVPLAVLNFVFDDGTENIRVVCFRDLVKQVLEVDDVTLLKENPSAFRDVQRKVAGKQLQVNGRVTMNTFFNRLEVLANTIMDANPRELAIELQ